jgi:hypothetical protein
MVHIVSGADHQLGPCSHERRLLKIGSNMIIRCKLVKFSYVPTHHVALVQVYLVDFEWAGKAGAVTYPLFMNRETEKWPEGATDGQPITKRHDSDWVEKLTKAA